MQEYPKIIYNNGKEHIVWTAEEEATIGKQGESHLQEQTQPVKRTRRAKQDGNIELL
jgi:hypothetical protein